MQRKYHEQETTGRFAGQTGTTHVRISRQRYRTQYPCRPYTGHLQTVATAEEYEVQKLLISRLENKILSLEARLSELEHKLRHMEERTSHPDGGK